MSAHTYECTHCGRKVQSDGPQGSTRFWCSAACSAAWDALHPEEIEGWIAVVDLTLEQRAELDMVIGKGRAA